MKDNKIILYLIIFFLFLFVLLSGLSVYYKYIDKENNNNEFVFSLNGEKIGSFNCVNTNCNYLKSISTDLVYINNNGNYKLNIFKYNDNNMAFIKDDTYKLVNIKLGNVLMKFEDIKYYSYETKNNYIFVKQNGKWGILSLNDFKILIPCSFDYLGIANNIIDNKIDDSKIVAKKDNKYYLMDINQNKLTGDFDTVIYNYNDKYIVLNNKIYDYEKTSYLSEKNLTNVLFASNYVFTIENNTLNVYNDLTSEEIKKIQLNNYNNINVLMENNKILIYLDNNLFNSFEI